MALIKEERALMSATGIELVKLLPDVRERVTQHQPDMQKIRAAKLQTTAYTAVIFGCRGLPGESFVRSSNALPIANRASEYKPMWCMP
jgi:hypothetical protein